MTDSVKFDLPSSGYDVIDKIIHAYVRSGQQAVSLDEVASRASMHKTQISPNHKFLVAVGILEGAAKKKLTTNGLELAQAISNELTDEVSQHWAKIMRECEHTNKVLDMIHIQKGSISRSNIQGKVLQALSMHSSRDSKTGANCLVELLLRANLLQENDGKFVRNPQFDSSGDGENEAMLPKNDLEDTKADEAIPQKKQIVGKAPICPDPSLHIDVQIHIDANATPEQIDQIFASMAKHLYGRS